MGFRVLGLGFKVDLGLRVEGLRCGVLGLRWISCWGFWRCFGFHGVEAPRFKLL